MMTVRPVSWRYMTVRTRDCPCKQSHPAIARPDTRLEAMAPKVVRDSSVIADEVKSKWRGAHALLLKQQLDTRVAGSHCTYTAGARARESLKVVASLSQNGYYTIIFLYLNIIYIIYSI